MEEKFMKCAITEAKKAYEKLEVPIGAVIVKDGNIIARAHNLRETKKQACAHAEILAIEKACKKLGAWRLENCEMYITLEPCAMCAGAIINSRIKKIYIGAMDPKGGAVGSKINLLKDIKLNHETEIQYGVCSEECSELLKDFFKELRKGEKFDKKQKS